MGVSVRSYLAEISDTPIRGAAALTTEIMKGTGAIIIIGFGMIIHWYYLALFCGCFVLLFGLLFVPLLPESPTYLVVSGRDKEARHVLRHLRGPYVDLDEEIQQLKEQNQRDDEVRGLGIFLKPDIVKKCMIIFGLLLISNLCGTEVIRSNALRMLQTSGLTLDKDVSTILVFVLVLSGNLSQMLLVDRIGRRKCLILSLILLVLAYTILGIYIFFDSPEIEIIPLIAKGNTTTSGTVTRYCMRLN